ncbi:zinc-dependent alcohol dehydrogenase family protein [Agrilactobacillus fermenti]|uniref:zinc-dependent alcohol dehydrogenase family protein n=1 Tax=Agrilactobacillus fermenti TaxID=2586909 RepID=UPI001E3AA900|nr:zinc-dependent alcohol dehydrogenase family protein [Agrilactobacillus fermenti]MCD2257462.1 zinc-dependent alcohol dehydrogenase family protein [Agrilactobacillus fermenti]
MKALVLEDTQKMVLKTIERPALLANEVQVQMKYVGICGTDKHLYNGQPGSAQAEPPVVLGHENAGIISAVGDDVRADLKVGQRVTIDPNIPCGYCRYCHEGRPQLCLHNSAIGVTRNGGMAEYVNVPATNIYPIPDNLSLKAAAMTEPVSCVMHGIHELNIQPHQSVLIIGDGFVGQLFTRYFAQLGMARVVVSGHNPKKVELLHKIGADEVFDPAEGEHGAQFDIVIECVGLKQTQTQAIASAAKGGQVLMFGVSNPEDMITINSFDIYAKELTIKGAFINPYAMGDAITLLANKKVNVEALITHELTLADVPDVLAGRIDYKITKAVVKL